MSRAAQLLAKFERMTTINFQFDRKHVTDSGGKALSREVIADMERAENIELQAGGTELMGFNGRNVVFTASGYVDEDSGKFAVESYYSAKLQSRNGFKFEKNTTNPEAFKG